MEQRVQQCRMHREPARVIGDIPWQNSLGEHVRPRVARPPAVRGTPDRIDIRPSSGPHTRPSTSAGTAPSGGHDAKSSTTAGADPAPVGSAGVSTPTACRAQGPSVPSSGRENTWTWPTPALIRPAHLLQPGGSRIPPSAGTGSGACTVSSSTCPQPVRCPACAASSTRRGAGQQHAPAAPRRSASHGWGLGRQSPGQHQPLAPGQLHRRA